MLEKNTLEAIPTTKRSCPEPSVRADDGVMRGLLIHGRRAGVPANTDGRKTVGPCNGTFPDTRIHDQNLTVMIGSVGLDHGQRGVHPVPTFIQVRG